MTATRHSARGGRPEAALSSPSEVPKPRPHPAPARLEELERPFDLGHWKGWQCQYEAPPRHRPLPLTLTALQQLSTRERAHYNEQRRVWHANLGPYRTPSMSHAAELIELIVDSNGQDSNKARPAALLDAYPGLGKTTLGLHLAAKFHARHIDLYGANTPEGHRRVPVVYITLSGNTTLRSLNAKLCCFFGHASGTKGNATDLGELAARAVRQFRTKLIVIDDVHFLDMARRDGREVANHFKTLANTFPATFLFIGVDVGAKGLLTEGLGPGRTHLAQTARRWTSVSLDPFAIDTDANREVWRRLLLSIERDIVLAEGHQGMIANDLAAYLYARSTGHFQSLMTILIRGCRKAIEDGTERLTVPLLDTIPNDDAAERARKTIEASLSRRR